MPDWRALAAIRVVAWTLVVLALGFIVVAEVGLGERQTFRIDLAHGDGTHSALGPPSRLAPADPRSGAAVAVGEPVYFDVALPALTEYADVLVSYSKPSELAPPQFGVSTGDDSFRLLPLATVGESSGMTLARVSLDLRGVPRRDGAYRFFLSAPGVGEMRPLAIGEIVISARRSTVEFMFARAVAGFSAKLRGI